MKVLELEEVTICRINAIFCRRKKSYVIFLDIFEDFFGV